MRATPIKKFLSNPAAALDTLAANDLLLLLDENDTPCYTLSRVPDAPQKHNSFIGESLNVVYRHSQQNAAAAPTAPPSEPTNGAQVSEEERDLFGTKPMVEYYINVVRPIFTHANDPAVRIYRTGVPDLRATLRKHGGIYARVYARKEYILLKLKTEEHN